jgi:hypothetical protein
LALISAYGTGVLDEDGNQLLALRRQAREPLEQRSVAFGREQLMFRHLSLLVGDVTGARRVSGSV